MKKMMLTTIIVTMVLSVSVFGNLLTNGSFEEPDQADSSWSIYDAVPGWSIIDGDGLEVWDPTVVAGVEAYDGDQCVELDGWENTKISQTVETVPGALYELSYAWMPRPGVDCQMKVWVDGVEVGDHSGTDGDWTYETYPFTAANSSTTIAFAEIGDSDTLGMLLDAVNLVYVNSPPDCSNAAPSIAMLWPPNHKFVPITIMGVTDPDGDPIAITIDSIFQDEPVNARGSGNTAPDGKGVGTDTAKVRAERSGSKKVPGNGRVYHIDFTADDGNGGTCNGTVTVCVPHDKSGNGCVDDGPLYDSTVSP